MDRGGAHERDDAGAGESGQQSDAEPASPPLYAERERLAAPGDDGGGRLELTLDDADEALTLGQRQWLIETATRAVEEALKHSEAETGAPKAHARGHSLRVRVVAAYEMASLHERAKGDAAPTDVLTFDLRDEPSEPLDADIVICADVARAQAAASEGALERELLLYILHGVLHCLGYDDRDAQAAARMHAREDEALERIGVGAVYSGIRAQAQPRRAKEVAGP